MAMAVAMAVGFLTIFIDQMELSQRQNFCDFFLGEESKLGCWPVFFEPAGRQRFQSQFAGRLVEKEYLCLCEADSTVAKHKGMGG